jgi:hypothetical protein
LAASPSPSPAYATPLARPIAATAARIMVLMASLLSPALAQAGVLMPKEIGGVAGRMR